MWIFPLAAAIVGLVFASLIAQTWVSKRKPQNAAWALSLLMFSIAAFAAAIGSLDQWTPTWFRTYYLFGAIINVPVLALGTIYLLAPKWIGHAASVLVAVAAVFAAGSVLTASIDAVALANESLPSAGDFLSEGVRALSRYYSYSGFLIVVLGALWSAWRLSKTGAEFERNLASGNILIAAGTMVVAIGSISARLGQVWLLGIALLAGISLMFVGFLRTRRPAAPSAQTSGAADGPSA